MNIRFLYLEASGLDESGLGALLDTAWSAINHETPEAPGKQGIPAPEREPPEREKRTESESGDEPAAMREQAAGTPPSVRDGEESDSSQPTQLCKKCGPKVGPLPVSAFSRRLGKPIATCKACMFEAQEAGRIVFASRAAARAAAESAESAEGAGSGGPEPRSPQPLFGPQISTPTNGHAPERDEQAIARYRAHLDAGNPPSNGFEGELMAEFGLNRTEVMKMRDYLMNERKGRRTLKCTECKLPFEASAALKDAICPDCRGVGKAVDREMEASHAS